MGFLSRLFGLEPFPKTVEHDPIDDPILGPLVWSSRYDWWEGSFVHTSGEKFELNVSPGDEGNPQPTHSQRIAFQREIGRLAEIRDGAMAYAMENFNSKEDPMSPDQLAAELVPGSIHLDQDIVEISFLDGESEFLGGHAIVAHLKPDGSVDYALEG